MRRDRDNWIRMGCFDWREPLNTKFCRKTDRILIFSLSQSLECTIIYEIYPSKQYSISIIMAAELLSPSSKQAFEASHEQVGKLEHPYVLWWRGQCTWFNMIFLWSSLIYNYFPIKFDASFSIM